MVHVYAIANNSVQDACYALCCTLYAQTWTSCVGTSRISFDPRPPIQHQPLLHPKFVFELHLEGL